MSVEGWVLTTIKFLLIFNFTHIVHDRRLFEVLHMSKYRESLHRGSIQFGILNLYGVKETKYFWDTMLQVDFDVWFGFVIGTLSQILDVCL